MKKNILIICGHTNTTSDSVANKTIMEQLETALPGSRTVYLDRLYPDFRINTAAEQERLLWADVIVLQFPVYWFSMPSLLHRWMEETFLHGFSHGSTGDKLRGKTLIISYTTGAPADAMDIDITSEIEKAIARAAQAEKEREANENSILNSPVWLL